MNAQLGSRELFDKFVKLLEEGIGLEEGRKLLGVTYYKYVKTLSEDQRRELRSLTHVYKKAGTDIFDYWSVYATGSHLCPHPKEPSFSSEWPKLLKGKRFTSDDIKFPTKKAKKSSIDVNQLIPFHEEGSTGASIVDIEDILTDMSGVLYSP